jgi:hypothetical protein
LRGRLRSDARDQHIAAWWELYNFILFRRLGYAVTPHPSMPNTTKKPDFLVVRDSVETVVECAVMLDEARWTDSDGVAWVLECIDSAESSNFRVGVEFTVEGSQRPKRRVIVRAVDTWLASLDADTAHQRWQESPGDAPSTEFRFGDWVVALTAFPIPPEKRAIGPRLILRYPMKSGQLAHTEQMGKILSDKGSRYGQLRIPFVLSLLAWPITAGEFEMANALFGPVTINVRVGHDDHQFAGATRNVDGYWRPGPNPGGSRISAVLLGEGLKPDRPFITLPRLWISPWAAVPLPSLEPFETVALEGDQLVTRDATMTAEALFGHPPDWPHGPIPGWPIISSRG